MNKMDELRNYVEQYAERGQCCCGKCIDAPENPEDKQPTGHVADMIFFKVAAKNGASAGNLKELVSNSVEGEYGDVNLFDGKEHNYLEVGGWIGDQGQALMLMGLGTVLGLWNLLTPVTILRLKTEDPLTQQMAGMGMISIKNKI